LEIFESKPFRLKMSQIVEFRYKECLIENEMSSSENGVGVNNLKGIFIVFMIGNIMALIIFITECWNKIKSIIEYLRLSLFISLLLCFNFE